MSSGLFVLAHFSDSDKLLPAVEILKRCDEVSRWNAVDGGVHLIMKLTSPSLPQHVSHIDGVDALTEHAIVAEYESTTTHDASLCHTYVFVETEPAKSESVTKALQALEAVLFCATLAGGSEFVVLLQTNNFETANGIINGRIRMLDGVLRLKKNRVIELKGI